MIRLDDVSVRYGDTARTVLRNVDLTIGEGEFCLVSGVTGAGKSTLLGVVDGLVPHYTGGTLFGRVTVCGKDTAGRGARELAALVGVVGQDPADGFVTDTVGDELDYAAGQSAADPAPAGRAAGEVLELLGLAGLRHRTLCGLSDGEQQRVAIGAALAARPRVLVLDEPTSALDPVAAEEVMAAVARLARDTGVSVLLAEHRLERVAQYADRMLHLPGDGSVVSGRPAEVLRTSVVAPPVVELGRLVGWEPLPLSVGEARRAAAPLRARLAGRTAPPARRTPPAGTATTDGGTAAGTDGGAGISTGGTTTGVLVPRAGEVTVLMGRSGCGKSSLLRGLAGTGPRGQAGRPYLGSVGQELSRADRTADAGARPAREILDRLAPGIADRACPLELSEGQRLSLALAVRLTEAPGMLLLDEPTRGLDYRAKAELACLIGELAATGRTVAVSTHDAEFAARAADRVAVLSDGLIVTDGPAADVLASSADFAPQVARVLAPLPCLTAGQAAALLGP
ncbi:ATP-binding cassette domain-containing protein [Streptomyces sp. NPDC051567]|uniref:ATP-binding cassette domain-containing protein n=1 Tax=Streptomyces sp. NPDC051567 TaxID=3365660 RepID=UPI0037A556EC